MRHDQWARRPRALWGTAALIGLMTMIVVHASPVTAATVSKSELEAEVLALTNEHRASVGCGPLRHDARLGAVARAHSDDMASRDFFDHVDPDGVDAFQRIENGGYRFELAGENLAAGRWRPADAVQQWLDSPPHRANIENCDFTEMGTGVAGNRSSTYRYYWTQVFATPSPSQAASAEPASTAVPEVVEGTASTMPRRVWRCGSFC